MESQSRKGVTQKRYRRPLLISVTAIIIFLVGFKFLSPPSPETIRDRAIVAIEREDAEELCRLADPDEVERLHLTPAIVSNFMHETLWRENPLIQARIDKNTQTPNDQSIWEVHWANEKPDTLKFVVPVIDDQKKGWKLNLSFMLYSACWRKEGGKEGMKTYFELARKYGIEGERKQGGNYQSMDAIAQQIKNVFGE